MNQMNPMKVLQRTAQGAVLSVLALTLMTPAGAAPDDRSSRGDRNDQSSRSERAERSDKSSRGDPNDRRGRESWSRPQPQTQPQPVVRGDDRKGDRGPDRGRPDSDRRDNTWWDGAHGHNHRYLPPGRVVVLPPRPPAPVIWGGINYRFWDGQWATSGPRGWITVRPPLGIFVHDLPSWRTAVVIGGLTYFYVNGVYYRDRNDGGYEVVQPPVAQPDAAAPDKTFVYPRQGQSAQQQASDEYECHRWAVTQSGFDPSGAATGQVIVSTTGRSDYLRAQAACLEGRGYTVR
jgi:hypothetical protein